MYIFFMYLILVRSSSSTAGADPSGLVHRFTEIGQNFHNKKKYCLADSKSKERTL